jgi:hypothetical protein
MHRFEAFTRLLDTRIKCQNSMLLTFASKESMRALAELLERDEPALSLIQAWAQEASIPVECLPPSAQRDSVLLALQVTTRSPLGPWLMEPVEFSSTGLAQNAGLGHPRLTRDLAAWNRARSSGFLLIADDAVGDSLHQWRGPGEDLGLSIIWLRTPGPGNRWRWAYGFCAMGFHRRAARLLS